MKKHFLLLLLAVLLRPAQGQDSLETAVIKSIYTTALSNNQGYQWLSGLTEIGGRLAGSAQADEAVSYFKAIADSLGFKTELQPVKVPHWVRGEEPRSYYSSGGREYEVNYCALGGSVPTPEEGLEAEVVEISSFEALSQIPENGLEGKIAFYNIPMDPAYINTFFAYSRAVKQRWAGALEASKKGAVAVITRSLSSTINKIPHTGSMTYQGASKKIPAISISTYDAENLSCRLKQDPGLNYYMKLNCEWKDSVLTHNLVADLPGKEAPEEYILISGHLDSWDLGDGAHDDGAGCVHALEAAWLLQKLDLLPGRSLRVVFYMNEEFGLSGARSYARHSRQAGIKHVIAMESDAGGFSPRGYNLQAADSIVDKVKAFRSLLEPYGIHRFSRSGAGADISQISSPDLVMVGLSPDNHRYFEIHHTKNDVLSAVNPRELEMGSAAMAALIYLLDKYDVVSR